MSAPSELIHNKNSLELLKMLIYIVANMLKEGPDVSLFSEHSLDMSGLVLMYSVH